MILINHNELDVHINEQGLELSKLYDLGEIRAGVWAIAYSDMYGSGFGHVYEYDEENDYIADKYIIFGK